MIDTGTVCVRFVWRLSYAEYNKTLASLRWTRVSLPDEWIAPTPFFSFCSDTSGCGSLVCVCPLFFVGMGSFYANVPVCQGNMRTYWQHHHMYPFGGYLRHAGDFLALYVPLTSSIIPLMGTYKTLERDVTTKFNQDFLLNINKIKDLHTFFRDFSDKPHLGTNHPLNRNLWELSFPLNGDITSPKWVHNSLQTRINIELENPKVSKELFLKVLKQQLF